MDCEINHNVANSRGSRYSPGDKVGEWVLVERNRKGRWLCRCLCGTERRMVIADALERACCATCLRAYRYHMAISKPYVPRKLDPNRIRLMAVKKAVCLKFSLRPHDLSSPKRTRKLSWPRMIAMSLARELTGKSLPDIGYWFSRDHTTVIHAVQRIAELRQRDPILNDDYLAIRAELTQRTAP